LQSFLTICSDHPESEAIEKEVEYCIENKNLFMAHRDGEVIIEDVEGI